MKLHAASGQGIQKIIIKFIPMQIAGQKILAARISAVEISSRKNY
jgi:hypothetical protein